MNKYHMGMQRTKALAPAACSYISTKYIFGALAMQFSFGSNQGYNNDLQFRFWLP